MKRVQGMTTNRRLNDHYFDHDGSEPLDQYSQSGIPIRNYVESALSEQQRENLFAWNGISRVTSNNVRVKNYYRVFVCQLDCIDLFRKGRRTGNEPWVAHQKSKKRTKWIRISTDTPYREIKKVKRLAIRALYILGFDMGVVDIVTTSAAPKQRLVRISPLTPIDENMVTKIKSKVKKVLDDANESKNAVLGADIEFVLKHAKGKYVLASRYFSRHGKVGHDAIWLRGNRNKYPIGELRPSPSENPKNLFKHVNQCLRIAVKKINNSNIEILAGGRPISTYPIGGHIHFSQVNLHSHFIRALDNYLTLPLFLLESDVSMNRRPKYGFIGDYREQFHGGFEYRTPPSFISNPTITKGVLCLAKVISNDYPKLLHMPLNQYQTQKAFYEGRKELIYPTVHYLWQEIKNCPSYNKYKNELDAFYSLIQERYSWNEYADIRKAWRLPPYQY